jgi:hypothetical protein
MFMEKLRLGDVKKRGEREGGKRRVRSAGKQCGIRAASMG